MESFNKKAKANEPEKGAKLPPSTAAGPRPPRSGPRAGGPGSTGSAHTAVALTAARFPDLAQSEAGNKGRVKDV